MISIPISTKEEIVAYAEDYNSRLKHKKEN